MLRLRQGDRYVKSDLYALLAVPVNRQKGSWNTGYLKYDNQVFIFANIGVAGRTGHDYNNHWEKDSLVWYGKTASTLNQPLIKFMLQPQTPVHVFTREGDRDAFTYQGLGHAIDTVDEVPVKIVWSFDRSNKEKSLAFLLVNKVDEQTLTKQIKQAPNDDISERIQSSRKKRYGQGKFRKNLFLVCGEVCCITGCDVKEVLYGCHIIPHAESGNNEITNGLILRSDIHDLFDAHLIGIHPTTLEIHIKNKLQTTVYKSLEGKALLPRQPGWGINEEALKKRWKLYKDNK